MLKKVVVILGCLVVLGFSAYLLQKTPKESQKQTQNFASVQDQTPEFPDTLFAFDKETLVPQCSLADPQLCAVETAVKCTINPEMANCKTADLPQFIFMKDSGVDRPTEISYRFTNKKVLPNQNTEFYTESSCNGTWFGLCQGTVIYVIAQNDKGTWYVKDIYAIE